MRVARDARELESTPRAIAIGTFDGVHLGHRRVVEAAVTAGAGLRPTVVTFDPHPRTVLGNRVEMITTLERRLELLADAGVEDTLVVEFTLELSQLEPERFAREYLLAIGAEQVAVGPGFRFGRRRSGDAGALAAAGLQTVEVEPVEGASSSRIRRLVAEGHVGEAAALLGRPFEVEGPVVSGDQRGGTLGFPTANLAVPAESLVPRYGIYAGSASGHRAAISIGVNPHYGGEERRVEAFLLDFAGDLYGRRLVVELWRYLREERAFDSEEALVDQIARDVAETRAATRPGPA
jgi:riboflavin kinase / FMN adenylyltransferase